LYLHEKNLFYHALPNNMKADHLRNFNSFALLKFGKYKKLTKSSESFPLNPELWMYHTQLTWYGQENQGYKAHFYAFPRPMWFLCLFTL
jgi:hypothetical protein